MITLRRHWCCGLWFGWVGWWCLQYFMFGVWVGSGVLGVDLDCGVVL